MQATVSLATCLCAVQRISKTLCTMVRQLLLRLQAALGTVQSHSCLRSHWYELHVPFLLELC
jgi:hypothetical protein